MPFTPFHFGPGLAAKAVVPERFSWTAFAAAQVLIDCETLYNILTRQYPLHRTLHTFIGATAAGLAAGAGLVWLFRTAPRLRTLIEERAPSMRSELGSAALLIGGVVGGASHPLFDGLMHSDVRPFLPWTQANPLLGAVGAGALHLGCLLAGLAGVGWLWARRARPSR